MAKNQPVFMYCGDCQTVFCPPGQSVWHTVQNGRLYAIIKKAQARGDKIICSYCSRCKSNQEGKPKGWKPEGWTP